MSEVRIETGLPRRRFLQLGALLAATAVLPMKLWAAIARPQAAFHATALDGAFEAIGGVPEDHDGIIFTTPDIAENGAVVPVRVEVDAASLPNVSKVYILVELNPNPLAAMFTLPEGTETYIETRVKVSQTCNLYAVVEADGKLYKTAKETKVTLGGCGG